MFLLQILSPKKSYISKYEQGEIAISQVTQACYERLALNNG